MPEQVYKVTRAVAAVQLVNQKLAEVERVMELDEKGVSKKFPNTTFTFAQDRLTFNGPAAEVRAIFEKIGCGGLF